MPPASESSDKNTGVIKAQEKERAYSLMLDAAKILGPAVIAIVVMYVKVQAQENAIDRLQVEGARNSEKAMHLETKLIALEATQRSDKSDASSGQREVIAALKRVEDDIRELKGDVKDLRKTSSARANP